MGAIEVFNKSRVAQGIGHHTLPPGQWTELPYKTALSLAGLPDFRVEDPALLSKYKFLDNDKVHLGWSSPFHYADGYGSIAQEIAAEFLRMGVALSIFPRDYYPSDPRCGGLPLDEWEEKAYVPRPVVERLRERQEDCFYGIHMTWPRELDKSPFPRGIGLTMFETTLPPREWAKNMNQCRRVIVPCNQNKRAFIDIGVTTPIDVVPLGVNPDLWPMVDRSKWARRDKPFTFLMSAGLTMRKNPLGAARAFVDAFPGESDVQLVLKTRGGNTAAGFWDWAKELPQDSRMKVICEDSTPEEMHAWMAGSEAFVFPSHGEGFGLTPLQAMSTGLPVIVSDNSGMSEYCDGRFNYPIPCREIPVPEHSEGGFPPAWGDCGNWWDPDHDALVQAYRTVYGDYDAAVKKGKAAARWVRERWTVRHTCEGILTVVMDDAQESGLV